MLESKRNLMRVKNTINQTEPSKPQNKALQSLRETAQLGPAILFQLTARMGGGGAKD